MNSCQDTEYHVADRAHYYLTIWRDWMRHDDTGLGFPSKVPVLLTQGAYWDCDAQLEALDAAAAMATDAVILGLQPYQKMAIRNAYEHCRAIIEGPVMAETYRALMQGLNRRGFF